MTNKILTVITGTAGIVGVEAAEAIPTPEEVQAVGTLIIQAIIAIFTIIGLLRKKKKADKPSI